MSKTDTPTASAAPPFPELPELPELEHLLSDLRDKLDLEGTVLLGENPNLRPGDGTVSLRALPIPSVWQPATPLPSAEDHGQGDLSRTIMAIPGTLDYTPEPDAVLDLVDGLLDQVPLAVLCVREKELVAPVLDPDDPAPSSWSFGEFDALLRGRGMAPVWGGLTMTNRAHFERNHSVFLLTRDEAVASRIQQLFSTGLRSFTFAPGFGTTAAEEARPARVAICTDEIFGPSRNGGVGTAYTAMAEFLARGGGEVTVFFSGDVTSDEPIDHWIDHYQKKNIRLIPLALEALEEFPWQDEYFRRSHVIYRALQENSRERPFDAIHFPECNARGFYTILAKHQGLGFADTTICIGTHGNTRWIYEGHGQNFHSTYQLANDFMEQVCVRWCDVVVSPSLYLIYWMQEKGWALPETWYGQQNLQPFTARGEDECRDEPFPLQNDIEELVFFGRLEARKGLVPFCDALDILAGRGDDLPDFSVSFMGKEVDIEGTDSSRYLEKRAKDGDWGFNWQILGNFNQDKAVAYLQGENRVAIIPSLQDNSPYTVLECIGLGIPFLSQRIGGISELIDPRDVAQCTFYSRTPRHRPDQLAAGITRILEHGIRPSRRSVSATETDAGWVDFHRSIVANREAGLTAAAATQPAAITGDAVDAFILAQASDGAVPILRCAESLLAQEPPPASLRVLLPDDAEPGALANFRETVAPLVEEKKIELAIQAPEDATSPARWLASQILGHGEAPRILLAHANTRSREAGLSTFANVQKRTGADLLTAFMRPLVASAFRPGELEELSPNYFPIGAAPLLPLFANPYGMGQLLTSREMLARLADEHADDLDPASIPGLVALATAQGFHHEVIPEYLLDYVKKSRGQEIHVNNMPVSKCVLKVMDHSLPPHLQGFLDFAPTAGMGAGEGPGADLQAEIYALRHRIAVEFPNLQSEFAEQSKWLEEREEILTATQEELAKRGDDITRYKQKVQELKFGLREEGLKKKIVEKEREILTYKLNRKLGHKIAKLFGGGKDTGATAPGAPGEENS